MVKPKLIIAGPGAGKTYNMVQTIIEKLPKLDSSKYMAVITYTNSAAENIKSRLGKKIDIPKNLYIGTIHSFINRFIVVPYSSLNDNNISVDKLFIQCDTDAVFEQIRKASKKTFDFKQKATIIARIKESLNKKGYISFDQSVALAKNCMANQKVAQIVSNRIQYLFIDEFQDTDNAIFQIIDVIRKCKKTEIYCVGDPEQFIQSFDIATKVFGNIPILKSSGGTKFEIELNQSNHRSSERIVGFLNKFNSRTYGALTFSQISRTGLVGENIKFITTNANVVNIIPVFNTLCDGLQISQSERCIIAKKNDMIDRVVAALGNRFKTPVKAGSVSPIKLIIDTMLTAMQLNQTKFLAEYKTDINTLRKNAVTILKAIKSGEISNENTFAAFMTNKFSYTLKAGIPIKIDSIRALFPTETVNLADLMVSNIHNIKGLEADAVLAIAKTEAELLLWIETDRSVREQYRDKETTDYPRLGYVAFSRAKMFLCIACLQPISDVTRNKLIALGIEFV